MSENKLLPKPFSREAGLHFLSVVKAFLAFSSNSLNCLRSFSTSGESLGSSWVKTTDESNTIYTATISLPASNAANTPFIYKANNGVNGGKPLNSEQYEAMVSALSSVHEAITFAASVKFEIIA